MPGLSVLFWNVNRKPLATRVARLAETHAVDVIAVAECPFAAGEFETVMGGTYRLQSFTEGKLRVWTQAGVRVETRKEDSRWQVFRIGTGPTDDIVLVVAHMVSKLRRWPADQHHAVRRLVESIEEEEEIRKHRRTVLVGDLNMNPFEPGLASADGGLHSVMCGRVADRLIRTVDDQEYRFFYNPMWGLFGDRTPGPPGTYYTGSDGVISYFWEMLDQVLVRPALIRSLSSVTILDSDGQQSLLTRNGLPDGTTGSDHLPILFCLD